MSSPLSSAGGREQVWVHIRLPGKGDSNSHGARPVHQKHRWIRTGRLSIKNSLSAFPLLVTNAFVINLVEVWGSTLLDAVDGAEVSPPLNP